MLILSKLIKPQNSLKDALSSEETPSPQFTFSFEDFESTPSAAVTECPSEEEDTPIILLEKFNTSVLGLEEFVHKTDESSLSSSGQIPLLVQNLITHNAYSLEEDISVLQKIKHLLVDSLNPAKPLSE